MMDRVERVKGVVLRSLRVLNFADSRRPGEEFLLWRVGSCCSFEGWRFRIERGGGGPRSAFLGLSGRLLEEMDFAIVKLW